MELMQQTIKLANSLFIGLYLNLTVQAWRSTYCLLLYRYCRISKGQK